MRNRVAAVSVLMILGLAAACGGDDDDDHTGSGGASSGGGSGTGGATGGGGSATGGRPSTGGAPGTGGASAVDGSNGYLSTDTPGVTFVFGFSDVRSTHDVRSGDAPRTACSSGTISRVMDQTEWATIWGAGFGFQYAPVNATNPNDFPVEPFDATGLATIKLNLADTPPGGVRVSLVLLDLKQFFIVDDTGFPLSYMDGEVEIPVAALDVPMWTPPEGREGHYTKEDLDLTQLRAIQIGIPSNEVAAFTYEMCASDVQLLDASGNSIIDTSGGTGGAAGASGAAGMGGAAGGANVGGAGGASD